MKIIKSNSKFRIVWDLFMLLLILISCILIPYQFVFQQQVIWQSTIVIYLIDIFFFIDIYFNFHTSFRFGGQEIRIPQEIRRNYMRTLFPVDLLANIPLDAILLFLAPEITIFNVSIVLLFRLLRLLRVSRLFTILRRWEFQAWTNSGYLRIVRFIFTITLLIHWIACTWFFSAFASNFPKESWVASANISDASPIDQYIRSIYWTITTMTTVGFGDITPQRSEEYIIAMVVMLLGASMYAFIIGNVASLFSNLDAEKVRYRNRMEAISQYLQHRKVPDYLNAKVRDYYEYMWTRRRGIQEEQMLIDLPGPLRLEVLLHLTKELLEKVPLFRYCSSSLRNNLLDSLIPFTYPPDGYVARAGDLGKELFFVSKGKLEVTSQYGEKVHAILEEGDYFGDLSLLLKEKRTASVRTLTYCEIFILEEKDFSRMKNEYPEFKEVIKKMSAERTEKTTALILEGVIL